MMKILPTTKLGRWSVWLIVAFFLLLATGITVVQVFHQRGGEIFFGNLWISVPMLSAGACVILALFVGIAAIWKQKERAVLVFLSILIGFLVLWFILGEILVPH